MRWVSQRSASSKESVAKGTSKLWSIAWYRIFDFDISHCQTFILHVFLILPLPALHCYYLHTISSTIVLSLPHTCLLLASCKQVGRTDCLTIQCTELRPAHDIVQPKADTDEKSEQSDGLEQSKLEAMSREEQAAALAAVSPEARKEALAAMSPDAKAAAIAALAEKNHQTYLNQCDKLKVLHQMEKSPDDLLHVDEINLVSDISEPAKSQNNSAAIELRREQCERMFDRYDLDRSGFLDTPEELNQCLMNLAFKLLPDIEGEGRQSLVDELQAAGSILLDDLGAISKQEFVEWIEQALPSTTLGIICCCA